MIEISHVTKSFGEIKAVDDVSILIPKGSIYGIIGENGAGKSTILQCLTGIYDIDQGSILIEGEPVYENNAVKRRIGYVADRNQFFKSYTVKQMAAFFKLTYPTFSEGKFNQYNEIFKIDLKSKIKNLSKGMQMRLSTMLSIASSPKLLVLDEPTLGLDAIAKRQMLDLIIDEVSLTGMTVVISSHHLTELEKICDEITIINDGKVTYQASVDALKAKVKKLQVVFEEMPPGELVGWDEILKIDKIGSVYYIVTDNYSIEFESKLRAQGAKIIEPIGLI
ncbi:ABC transporter ATP-binding protein [Cellulosilyticum sp. I15G10I2]|uniref:ABC transporter ATP-binding protein n=1 Tax=Cellulosilyticum sp. I15G10I2 TaxID=1892843 RepID=UPI0009F16164|nr:ABC transporter ATP-binding protein [Cellulosilyticum sp. I15G10I2]